MGVHARSRSKDAFITQHDLKVLQRTIPTGEKETVVEEKHSIQLERPRSESDHDSDIEAEPLIAGKPAIETPAEALEYAVPTRKKLAHLAVWFAANLALTIYNKAIFRGFNFPWLITAIHCSSVTIGCYGLKLDGWFSMTKLSMNENLVLVAFSSLFTLNIAISNVSLAMVTVPFHQILRATVPALTVFLYRVGFGRVYGAPTYLSLIPIIAGVALTTYGEYSFTALGFIVTMLGAWLAAFKTIASNKIMTGSLALSAYEVLLRMSPLAALQSLVYAGIMGEANRLKVFYEGGGFTGSLVAALAFNGLIAFVLNVASFQTNKLAGALTMSVAGNLKQILTVLLGIVLFNVTVGPLNGLGMVITMSGAALYSKVELDSRGRGQ